MATVDGTSERPPEGVTSGSAAEKEPTARRAGRAFQEADTAGTQVPTLAGALRVRKDESQWLNLSGKTAQSGPREGGRHQIVPACAGLGEELGLCSACENCEVTGGF